MRCARCGRQGVVAGEPCPICGSVPPGGPADPPTQAPAAMPQGYDTQWTAPAANHVWLPSVPQRVRGIGVAAAIALLITSFFYLMDLVYPLAASALVGRAAESEDVDLLNLTWSMELPLLLLIAIGTLTTAVLVIVWLYRAR